MWFRQSAGHPRLLNTGSARWPFFRLGCALLLTGSSAFAQLSPTECIQAHAKAQELEGTGRLFEALGEFETCSSSSCPKLIQKDCKVLRKTVEEAISTLDVVVVEPSGRPPVDYRIELEDREVAPTTLYQNLPVDPGLRHLKVRAPERPATQVSIVVRPKEKHQRVIIQLPPVEPLASEMRKASYVLAGIGGLGILSFTGFAISGYLDEDELKGRPRTVSRRSDYQLADTMRTKYLIADVSLGISLVSLGAATYLWLKTKGTEKSALESDKTAIFLGGSPNGGVVYLRQSF
jgi:hypothetical protein